MKRIPPFFGLLVLLAVLAFGGPVRAETVTFLAKAFCPIKYEINWPFTSKVDKKSTQGSGIVANVSELPKDQIEEKSATELGSNMNRLLILKAPLEVGQHVSEEQILITYEMPLENLVAEKEALSKGKVNEREHTLAMVEQQLASFRQKQADLDNQAASQSVAPIDVRTNSREIEALLLQREYILEELELARQRYDNAVVIAQSKYGLDVDVNKLPRLGHVRSPMDGYILWVNSSLVPGMAFTKQASLVSVGRIDPMVIRASVHEIAVQKLKVGDKATVVFHSIPGETFETAISKVNFVALPAMMQQPSFYEIELMLPNPEKRIKEGMRCDVTVNLQ